MTSRRITLRSGFYGSISYLAAAVLTACPAIAVAGSADPPLVDTSRSSASSAVTSEQVQELPLGRDFKAVLDLHNQMRAGVGSPPVEWDQNLAQGAQGQADVLAQSGQLQHSPKEGRPNIAENLAVGPAGSSALDLARIWENEGQFFNAGIFPDVCESGDWTQCGHATQIYWFTTTHVGCGYGDGRYASLVCWYTPSGNRFGRPVLGTPPVLAQGPAITINDPPQDDGPVGGGTIATSGDFRDLWCYDAVAGASLTGNLSEWGVQFPWATSGVGLALGVEYRKERLDLQTDIAFQTYDLAGQSALTLPVSGDYDVREAFAELRIPIVEESFIHELSLELGYRYSDYGVLDRSFNTDTYKIGGFFAPVQDIRFRGGYNRAVRAPNIQELFAPQRVALTEDVGNIFVNPSAQYNSFISGSPELDDFGNSWTIGTVIQPRFLPRLNITVDYFDIEIESAIAALGNSMLGTNSLQGGCSILAGDGFLTLLNQAANQPGPAVGPAEAGAAPQIAQGPVINVSDPPAPAAAPQPEPEPEPGCQVPEPDDFIKLLNQAALQSGLGIGGLDPKDETTQRQWGLALEREQDIQNRMMKELATLQGDVAKHINAYLAATSAWQELYVHIASSSTGLQGLLTNWLEARGIYEKADLAFALANLGVGGAKLGFKAYKFFTTPRAAAGVADDAAAGATRLAGATDDAAAAAAGATDEAAALATGETQAFNRTLVPPGQNPNVQGMAGHIRGTSSASGSQTAAAVTKWEQEVAQARSMLAEVEKSGAGKAVVDTFRSALDDLLAKGPPTASAARPGSQVSSLARGMDDLDDALIAAGREAGVNVEAIAAAAGNAEARNLALMRAIAEARGWHDIPKWAGDPIANVLIQARKLLAGADDVRISPEQLEVVKSLKTYVESQGLNFAQWLRTAAGEVSSRAGQLLPGETEGVAAIVRYFDEADINLLLKVLDTGGDAAALRNVVNPVTQASLNGLGRAGQALGGCGALDTGLALQGVGGTLEGAGNIAGNAAGASAPGAKPSDAQLANVLYGTGKLGEVGLGNVVDQFGVTDRFTAGQSLPRAMLGELWELFTSPSATVASHYYTHVAQGEYLDLLTNEKDRLIELGVKLADAARALESLHNTLQRAGLSAPGSYLGSQGPADLRRALDDLEKTYNTGSDDWKKNHKGELDARRDHINQKLAALAETVSDLNALTARMQNVRNWLDSLRTAPGGGLRSGVDLFDPQVFVRLGSISLYLRGMGADAFGLTSDAPFRVVVPQMQPQQPQLQKASLTDEEIEQKFNEEMERMEQRARELDAIRDAPETEVDPDFDAWLNNPG